MLLLMQALFCAELPCPPFVSRISDWRYESSHARSLLRPRWHSRRNCTRLEYNLPFTNWLPRHHTGIHLCSRWWFCRAAQATFQARARRSGETAWMAIALGTALPPTTGGTSDPRSPRCCTRHDTRQSIRILARLRLLACRCATRRMKHTHYQRSKPRLSAAANSSDFANAFVSSRFSLSLFTRF